MRGTASLMHSVHMINLWKDRLIYKQDKLYLLCTSRLKIQLNGDLKLQGFSKNHLKIKLVFWHQYLSFRISFRKSCVWKINPCPCLWKALTILCMILQVSRAQWKMCQAENKRTKEINATIKWFILPLNSNLNSQHIMRV